MNKPVAREGFIAADEPKSPAPTADTTAETAAVPFVEKWPVKVRLLHKPIRNNNNEEVTELSFREPTGADINRYGNPCRVDSNFEIVIDDRKMIVMMAALSGILSPNLERMDPRDLTSCAYRLRGFFLPDPTAW